MKYFIQFASLTLVILSAVLPAVSMAAAQMPPVVKAAPPNFGMPDPCAGTGATGSSSYGACQLRNETLRRGAARAPSLNAIDQTDRYNIEQACTADLQRGDAIYGACVRRQLLARGQDPTMPSRRVPETQRKPQSLPNE